jgi:DNA-binding transcriptional ArsR family regulator
MSGVVRKGSVADRGAGPARSEDPDDDLVFKALASPVRRRMLDVLKESERTTGRLCEAFGELDRTTVLQHLRVLERAGLVVGTKVGRERRLTLAPLPIRRIYRRWIADYMDAAVDLLEDLGAE